MMPTEKEGKTPELKTAGGKQLDDDGESHHYSEESLNIPKPKKMIFDYDTKRTEQNLISD